LQYIGDAPLADEGGRKRDSSRLEITGGPPALRDVADVALDDGVPVLAVKVADELDLRRSPCQVSSSTASDEPCDPARRRVMIFLMRGYSSWTRTESPPPWSRNRSSPSWVA